MLALLDECLPRRLRGELSPHDVRTVQSMGWAGIKNGPLLRLMLDAGFKAFITADRNLRAQQNISESGVGLIVLWARSNRTADLLPLVPDIRSALNRIQPGEVIVIGVP